MLRHRTCRCGSWNCLQKLLYECILDLRSVRTHVRMRTYVLCMHGVIVGAWAALFW
jgi:hypothetical protein